MSKLLSRQGVRDLFLGLGLLCATLALMFWPQEAMEAAREGLRLCYNVILPSLFPFFVLSALVVDLGLAGYLGRALEGLMRPLFHVPGACASALVLGFVGGYPVGARTALSLYQKGMCTKTEAERLLSFCKLTLLNHVPFSAARKLFQKDRRTAKEKQVMQLARQALLSTAEIIKCAEKGIHSLPDEESILSGLYDDPYTTSDNISNLVKASPSTEAVTLAVANLYLRQQIIFERI